jgi:hypothetical protein
VQSYQFYWIRDQDNWGQLDYIGDFQRFFADPRDPGAMYALTSYSAEKRIYRKAAGANDWTQFGRLPDNAYALDADFSHDTGQAFRIYFTIYPNIPLHYADIDGSAPTTPATASDCAIGNVDRVVVDHALPGHVYVRSGAEVFEGFGSCQ